MNSAFIQGIGPLELVIVLVILLLVLGPKRLPGLARSAGAGLRELRSSIAAKDEDGRGSERPVLARAVGPAPEPAAVTAPSAEPVPERR
jgi:sec-independent protein translocase protein TatA